MFLIFNYVLILAPNIAVNLDLIDSNYRGWGLKILKPPECLKLSAFERRYQLIGICLSNLRANPFLVVAQTFTTQAPVPLLISLIVWACAVYFVRRFTIFYLSFNQSIIVPITAINLIIKSWLLIFFSIFLINNPRFLALVQPLRLGIIGDANRSNPGNRPI